ncbi:CidA/LrgA family protein [Histophilus somni]|uniref:CidA/LrgA family protein n=1 Tax=Histophilus somni TaxID=731 RepID=UPI0018EBE63A|nr:CidA/LrgA family protein [Histophilus somni]QQF85235.1 CidA/LrgA family protein [Histophilus somni]
MNYVYFEFARSFAVLYIALYLGNVIGFIVPLSVPASIWGLLVLFLGLLTKVIKTEWVNFGASLLIRYMSVLFVPVSMGIVEYADILVTQATSFLLPNIISTILTLVLIGILAEYLFSRRSFVYLRQRMYQKRQGKKII